MIRLPHQCCGIEIEFFIDDIIVNIMPMMLNQEILVVQLIYVQQSIYIDSEITLELTGFSAEDPSLDKGLCPFCL